MISLPGLVVHICNPSSPEDPKCEILELEDFGSGETLIRKGWWPQGSTVCNCRLPVPYNTSD